MIYGDKQYKDDEIKIPNISAIKQSGNLYVYALNNPIIIYDPTGEKVYIIGAELAGECGVRLAGSKGIIWDDNGNIGYINTLSIGAGIISAGISGFYGEIDTDNIDDLNGMSAEVGGSAGIGISLGYDYSTVNNKSQKYSGSYYSIGASVGIPVEGHAQLSFSKVDTSSLEALFLQWSLNMAKSIIKQQ